MRSPTDSSSAYHWHSATVRDFACEPHTAFVGTHAGTIMNLVDHPAQTAQDPMLTIARQHPEATIRELRAVTAATLDAPRHHDVRAEDVDLKRLGAVLAVSNERELRDFASLLPLENLAPRTLQSLALVAEVVHGTPCRFSDPALFSFALGGKDRHPTAFLDRSDEAVQALESVDVFRASHFSAIARTAQDVNRFVIGFQKYGERQLALFPPL